MEVVILQKHAAFHLSVIPFSAQILDPGSRQAARIGTILGKSATRLTITREESEMPAEQFVCVVHALTDGLLLKRSLTPTLITDQLILSAFEMLAREPPHNPSNR